MGKDPCKSRQGCGTASSASAAGLRRSKAIARPTSPDAPASERHCIVANHVVLPRSPLFRAVPVYRVQPDEQRIRGRADSREGNLGALRRIKQRMVPPSARLRTHSSANWL